MPFYFGPFDALPLWAVNAITLAIVLIAIEAGYRFGRYRRSRTEEEREGTVGAVIGATLALLGFILAFSFSLAATRFQDRRAVVVDEANAIGTCYLRAGLLPDGRGEGIRKSLREYVDSRIAVIATREIEGMLKQSGETHRRIWREAEAIGRDHPDSIVVGLFIQSLNEMIDIHGKRIFVALQNRMPLPLWLTLIATTVLTMTGVGYLEGLSRSRRSPAMFVLVLTFCVIIGLIADLDRPQEGWLRIGQHAMLDLHESMNEPL